MTKAEAAKGAIFEAGGPKRVARLLVRDFYPFEDEGKLRHRIAQWKVNGVPARYIIPMESVTGISRHDLDPEVYPQEEASNVRENI